MAASPRRDDDVLAAGNFTDWLTATDEALRGERDAQVACDGCTACCTASQFIHVGPDDADARAHIPAELLFSAPGLPAGHDVMGYDEHGHCPMLVSGACSIYEHRPRTCRTYDCRVFPAAGLEVALGDPDKEAIARQANRWRFDYVTADDLARHQAVRAAADYLIGHPDLLPDGVSPTNTTQLAVLAVEVHPAFLVRDGSADLRVDAQPDAAAVRVEVRRGGPGRGPS